MSGKDEQITIRQATPADRGGIIDLLRLSLGEGSTEKSADFWQWKHVDNPFGASPVLLAEADGKLVGVRAFMQWRWCAEGQTYRALRAVDTATHPEYRGRGIFKKLTLRLVEQCRAAGYDFIFNTPNEQSRPGYLKMGWQVVGKLPLRVAVLRPWQLAATKWLDRPLPAAALEEEPADFSILDEQRLQWLAELPDRLHTPPTVEFLRWRYADCPVRDYRVEGDPDGLLVFYYLREQNFGRELRIVGCYTRPGSEAALRKTLAALRRRYRPTVMSVAPSAGLPFYFLPALPLGLILTFRELNMPTAPPLGEWNYQLGELELF
jgi:GNAT superfamily N-acetyltransferase